MKITIEDQTFDLNEISRLYPAAMVKTGNGDELTQISLEWVDTLKDEETQVAKYAIFVHSKNNAVSSFFYQNREDLETALEKIASKMN